MAVDAKLRSAKPDDDNDDNEGDDKDDDACLLFEGHPGRHSFDLAQW